MTWSENRQTCSHRGAANTEKPRFKEILGYSKIRFAFFDFPRASVPQCEIFGSGLSGLGFFSGPCRWWCYRQNYGENWMGRIKQAGKMKKALTTSVVSARMIMVGETGFEPATPCSQGRCAARLRYSPTKRKFYNTNHEAEQPLNCQRSFRGNIKEQRSYRSISGMHGDVLYTPST